MDLSISIIEPIIIVLILLFPTDYGINSILYQRGIYPPETFEPTQQYGITILVSTDPKIKTFLNNILDQTKGGTLQPVVLSLISNGHD